MNDEDDDDTIWWAYMALRTQNEFNVFSNPMEMYRMTRSMVISGNIIKDGMEVLIQLPNAGERYQTGIRRGDLKIVKQVTDIIPLLKELNKDTKEMYNLLTR